MPKTLIAEIDDVVHQLHELLADRPRRFEAARFISIDGQHFNARMAREYLIGRVRAAGKSASSEVAMPMAGAASSRDLRVILSRIRPLGGALSTMVSILWWRSLWVCMGSADKVLGETKITIYSSR